jgi:long-chain acyl-CoA synthetase
MLAVPVYTSTGIHTFPLPCLTWGATMLYEDGFDAKAWARRAIATAPTHYFGVPSMLALILDQARDTEIAAVTTLRNVMFGGSPMPMDLAERLIAAFPGLRLWNLYGLTEAGPNGTALRPEDALRKLTSVGTPLPSVEIRIAGPNGSALGAGEHGEVLMRTPSVMAGYVDDPAPPVSAVDEDGWLPTGDIGRLDDEGFLTLLDRKNDMVVRGGFNVYPAEVEQAFAAHPDVAEAAVVGVPHAVLGEDVVACVVLRDRADTSPEELVDFCRQRVADYKAPRTVHVVDALPRNAMGKVLRRELREVISHTGQAESDGGRPGASGGPH